MGKDGLAVRIRYLPFDFHGAFHASAQVQRQRRLERLRTHAPNHAVLWTDVVFDMAEQNERSER